MISFDEAIGLIRSSARSLGVETVPLHRAARRVLAAPVAAQIDSPRSDVSAMDGYAVIEKDLERLPATLRVAGQSFAGAGWNGTIEPGTCARIFTGGPVPAGCDRVIVQEDVRRKEDLAIFEGRIGPARHIRRRGSDFSAGDELLAVGRLLDPRAMIAAAGADQAEIQVFRRPRVTILSTGDELEDPGAARARADAIPESVSFGLAALVEQWGCFMADHKRLRDDLESMTRHAAEAVEAVDVVIVTGGASVGQRDFARSMFEPLRPAQIFSKVSIKPGKPVWLSEVKGRFIVGLPGNPTSAFVTARLLLVPLLVALTGRRPEDALGWEVLPLASPLAACGARETFHRARRAGGAAVVLDFQDSSAQKALAAANLLVRQQANSQAMDVGNPVEVLDF